MVLNSETEEQLSQPLQSKRIKSREAGFGDVEYLPTYDVIIRANEIFGYDGWSGKIIDLTQEYKSKREDGKWIVVYVCSYEVTVDKRSHQDVEVGTAIRGRLPEAIENSIKFAVSDGIKRSLRAWGDQFGLSLYADDRESPLEEEETELDFQLINK